MDFEGRQEGEETLLVFRRHPIVMRRGFLLLGLALVIGALAGLILTRQVDSMTALLAGFLKPLGLGLIVGGLCFGYHWIGWYYSVCIVTDLRFIQIQQKGLFKSRSVNDINLGRILSVNYQVRGIFETLLGFGTIIIQTLAGDFVLRQVGHPSKVQVGVVAAIKQSGVELNNGQEAEIS